jgi:hypothetical protein
MSPSIASSDSDDSRQELLLTNPDLLPFASSPEPPIASPAPEASADDPRALARTDPEEELAMPAGGETIRGTSAPTSTTFKIPVFNGRDDVFQQ